MSDEMAFGVMREVWARGLKVPSDVSVVGVDDHDFASVVGLTTVQQQVAAHGAVAARLLLAQLADPPLETAVEPTVHVAESALVVRSSTGPPRHASPR
jgi:DNA-binding LacI/PurR family transcriptional regulator